MLTLTNTLTHKKEEFKPISDMKVGVYTCGPTVYWYAHIGNMLAYVFWDLLKRVLLHDGYTVTHVMNITDVGHLVSDADLGEDKMRVAMAREHKSPYEIAAFYAKKFLADEKRLNIIEPDAVSKATDCVPEMLDLISKLDKRGLLYKVDGSSGGMYFDTSKFKDYGRLSGHTFSELNATQIAGARVERPSGIRNITDFAVWRFVSPSIKDMVWDSPYGRGFPGWHIECSAIGIKYLGAHFDIHTGGVDHIQTHHTNEIAQSEGATGEKFVNYWLHNSFMTVDGKKMSKSLHNVYTLQDLIDKGYSPLSYRFFVLGSHYRSQLNFTLDALSATQKTLDNIYMFLQKLARESKEHHENGPALAEIATEAANRKREFFDALNDDLNSPKAIASMHALISATNRAAEAGELNEKTIALVLETMLEFDSILGLDFASYANRANISKEVEKLIEEREDARSRKDFAASDAIREKLEKEYNVIVHDTKEGVRWYLKGRNNGG